MKRTFPDSVVERWHRNFMACDLSLREFAREVGMHHKTLARAFKERRLKTNKRTPPVSDQA